MVPTWYREHKMQQANRTHGRSGQGYEMSVLLASALQCAM